MATALRRASVPVTHDSSGTRRGRSKTPSVNELSKKLKNTPKGKRRLEFADRPLRGKKFYLDLNGYRKISNLTTRIQELGGTIEEFLSKDINYLITNRKDADTRLSPRSNSTPSPGLSIPSPFPANRSSSMKGAWPSPLSGDSPQSIEAQQSIPKHDTRAKAIIKQAKATLTNKYGSCNILTTARTFGVCVIYLEKALEKLADYGTSKVVEKQPSIKELMGNGKKQLRVKIRKLQIPFIKVEDQSRHYRPLVKEFKQWPLPEFDSPVGTCPFDTPRKTKEQTRKKSKERDNQPKDSKKQQSKQGYCECCCLHYEALDVHLKSDHHQSFAKNDNNYQSLDQLIAQGPSLQVFLEKIKMKYAAKLSDNEAHNPYKTPIKNDDQDCNYADSPSKNVDNKKTANDANRPHTPVSTTMIPVKDVDSPNRSDQTESKRVTRSSTSPRNSNNAEAVLDKENGCPSLKNKTSSKEYDRDGDEPILEESSQQKTKKTAELEAKPEAADENVEKHQHERERKEPSSDSSVQNNELRFTRLRSSKKAECPQEEDSPIKRVLRNSKPKTVASDSTESLSDHVRRRPSRKRREASIVSSSTDSLSTKSEKGEFVDSPRKPKTAGRVTSTESLTTESQRGQSVDSTNKPVTKKTTNSLSTKSTRGQSSADFPRKTKTEKRISRSKNGKETARETCSKPVDVTSSPQSGPSKPRDEENQSIDQEKNCSIEAQAGSCLSTPKRKKSSKKSKGKRGKSKQASTTANKGLVHEEDGFNETYTSLFESSDSGPFEGFPSPIQPKQVVEHNHNQEQQREKTQNDTYTSLFDSDDDRDDFEGFDIPQFDGMSSEHDLSYRIKEIVNYFTSSQDSTLVEELQDGSQHKPKKNKRSPHGIKMILTSRTDDQGDDDDVFDEDEDDDNDDDASTIADSTDGNEDDVLMTSPLRLDAIYKRKSWNIDDLDEYQPPKRRRTSNYDDTDDDRALTSEEIKKADDSIEESDHEDRQQGRITRTRTLKDKHSTKTTDNGPASCNPHKNVVCLKKLESDDWKVVDKQQHRKIEESIDVSTQDVEREASLDSSSKENHDSHDIPPELLEPTFMSIEERVKMRRVVNQQSELRVNPKQQQTRKTAKKPTNATNKTNVRSASVTQSRTSTDSDSNAGTKNRRVLRSWNPSQVTLTPVQNRRKSSKDHSSPGISSNSQNAAWIFKPGKFSASTPQSSKKLRSKSTGKKSDTLSRTKLRSTSKCLVPGDSYEFVGDDVYAFE